VIGIAAGLLLAAALFHGAGPRARQDVGEPASVLALASSEDEENCTRNMFSDREPKLFCWSIMVPGPSTTEEALIRSQLAKRVGIFACNDYVVISRKKVAIGHDDCGDVVDTWVNDVKPVKMGEFGKDGQTTNSFLNTEIFMIAWETLIGNPRMWAHDWIAKVDPDAVFFPDRLRLFVKEHTGETAYYTNCWWDMQVGPKGGLMFGSLEVFSQKAIGAYHAGTARCKALDWRGWGEDMYMQKCMNALGVGKVPEFDIFYDVNCNQGSCEDKSRVSYHPYKDVGSYWGCWEKSGGR